MDQVTVCNRALSVIGTRSAIASMDEASPEADACSLHFEPACRAMLRLAPWSFARATVQAALIASAPGTPENPNGILPFPLVPNVAGNQAVQIVEWQYEYVWPQDCVRLRQVQYPFDTTPQTSGTVAPLLARRNVCRDIGGVRGSIARKPGSVPDISRP